MKPLVIRIIVVVAILGIAPLLSAQDKVDISGKWVFDVQTSAGGGMPTVTLKQDGEKLTGFVLGGPNGDVKTEIKEGTVKGSDVSFVVDREFNGNKFKITYKGKLDGDTIKGNGFSLDVLHTPGHAPDHLCFALVGKRTMFTGDHVMGWNTTVIAPPEGNMAQFLVSLERLMQRHDKMFLPAHGGRIQTPQRVVKAYIMHRKWREQTILACLDEGVCTIPRIVARLYGTLDTVLKQAAALSVYAHLEHLIDRDMVTAEDASGLYGVFSLAS